MLPTLHPYGLRQPVTTTSHCHAGDDVALAEGASIAAIAVQDRWCGQTSEFEAVGMDWLTDPQIWASLITLTALEIVLGIDNLVFITIVAGRLPPERQNRARQVGLALALVTRLALLASIVWIIGLTRPLFDLFGQPVSWRDIVLIAGGLFLLYKGTREIHQGLEGDRQTDDVGS